jgi:predicted ATP-grasp superfamily ATP-dependent carboligase
MRRILITGGRAPVALDLARRFAASGSVVFMADSAAFFLGRASRAVTRAYRVPPPRSEGQAFADAIGSLIKAEGIEHVVPTCEEVFYVARYADEWPEVDLFLPRLELLRQLHDKGSFPALARGLGIQVPDYWVLRSPGDLAQVPLPPEELVLKPSFSRFAVHTLIRPQVEALARLMPTPATPWVAQRFVQGREICSYSVAREGSVRAHSAYIPEWRAGQGSSTYFTPIRNELIEAFAVRFAQKFGYTGQFAFDFIESPDGQIHVLECNPRATSGVHLFGPGHELARSFFCSGDTLVRPPADARSRMLAPAMILFGLGTALKKTALRRWRSSFLEGKDAIWSAKDPLPSLNLYLGLCAFGLKAITTGGTLQAAATHDIEWDGREIP